MEAHVVNWAMYLVAQLVNKAKRVRENADSVLGLALPMLVAYFEDAAAVSGLMVQVSKVLVPALNKIRTEAGDCQCYVLKIWYANRSCRRALESLRGACGVVPLSVYAF